MGSFFIPMAVMVYVYVRISCVVAARHDHMTEIEVHKVIYLIKTHTIYVLCTYLLLTTIKNYTTIQSKRTFFHSKIELFESNVSAYRLLMGIWSIFSFNRSKIGILMLKWNPKWIRNHRPNKINRARIEKSIFHSVKHPEVMYQWI